MSVVGQGTLSGHLSDDVVARVVDEGLGRLPLDGRRVLVIIPDGTRTMPMPFMFDVIERGSTLQGVATIPEFIWELSFGIYLIVKGFRPSPILAELDSGLVARGASA